MKLIALLILLACPTFTTACDCAGDGKCLCGAACDCVGGWYETGKIVTIRHDAPKPPQSTLQPAGNNHQRISNFRAHHPIANRLHERRAINWARVKEFVRSMVKLFIVIAPWFLHERE